MKTIIISVIMSAFLLPFAWSQCDFSGCGVKAEEKKAEKEKCIPCDPCKCEVCECPKVKIIGTEDLVKIIEEKSALIFDARSGKWDDGERIPGAKSLNDKSTAEEIAALIPSKDAAIVVYCSNPKCPASDRLAKHLAKLGYTNIHEYPEGIDGWRSAGKPVEKVEKPQ